MKRSRKGRDIRAMTLMIMIMRKMKREICLPRPSRVDVASLETLGTKWLSTDLEEDPRITRTTIDEVG